MRKALIPVISGVMAVAFVLAGCGGGSGSSDGGNGSSGAAGNKKECFEWNDTKIAGFSDYGKKQTDIVIPSKCEGITGMLNDGAVVNVTFESDNDIDIGVAFSNSTTLKSIKLPKNMKTLMFSGFQSCTALETVVLPEDVTELPMSLFNGDTNLKDVTVGGSVNTIGMMCFNKCSSLTSIKLPSSLQVIDIKAFSGCSALSTIELPDGVTTIKDSAFENCTSLTSIKLPASLKEAGLNLFYKTSITDIYVPAEMELTSWDSVSFFNGSVNVHVTEGSWADQHFDEVFGGAVKTYD